ncbi:MAG: diguanylate cyclase [Lachnospiraceae bacterium]|nr:diguanylate cyclase [Lachnospiraceae bacterium]
MTGIVIAVISIALCIGIIIFMSMSFSAQKKKYVGEIEEKSSQIKQMTFEMIETIANTLDAKDEYTQGHSRRVAEYAVQIAKELGMSDDEVENIRYIALLHDIGKIGVPDAVLNKPGRLTDTEYGLMKLHTVAGGEILKDIDLFKDLDLGALYHHERYDGKGYPNGLKGEEIPYIARIICMADSYDAMTSNRIYRSHLSKDVVIAEIKRCSGTQFDPKIAEAFLKYLERNDDVLNLITDEGNRTKVDAGNKLLKKFMADQTEHTLELLNKDELTKVYNRSAGERYITVAMNNGKGTLFLLDLDNMRDINMQHGFRRGDYYITTVVKVLQESIPEVIISRFGGDEFLCYIPNVVLQRDIEALMDRVFAGIRRMEEKDELIENLSVSVGITVHDREDQELSELQVEADKALYHIKQTCKDNYYFYKQLKNVSEDFYKAEMSNLIEALSRKDNFSDTSILGEQDFYRIYEFIRDIAKNKEQEIRLIMFTAQAKSDENSPHHVTVEERDEIMLLVERAILSVFPDEGAVSRYSSVQRIVIVTDEEKGNLDEMSKKVCENFKKLFDDESISLTYDLANI